MTWAKLDDGFWMHPKILIVGNTGAGIFARLLSYCGCYLTDGLIPVQIVQQIAGTDKKLLAQLHDLGLIEVQETGSVVIRDYLEHNRSKEEVESDRATRRRNGAQGGRPKRSGVPA